MNREPLSEVLVDFAQTLVREFSIQEILERLVARVPEILPVSGAGVIVKAPETSTQLLAASDETARRILALQAEIDGGPFLAACESAASVMVPRLSTDERFPLFATRAVEAGISAVFTFPLALTDRSLGVLDLYSDVPVEFEDQDQMAAQILADVVGAYLFYAQAWVKNRVEADQSRHRSLHDQLTGLPNRSLLDDRFEQALATSRRSANHIGVLFLDIDRFRTVNDDFGHYVGDQLLMAVADRLSRTLRPGDTLARPGGDEFVALCEGLAAPGQADHVAERMLDSLTAPFAIGAHEIHVSASVGVATATDGDVESVNAIRHADAAMYLAKHQGGNQRRTVSDVARLDFERRRDVERDLAGAIERDELRLEYQPIVQTTTNTWTRVEALLRWDHPNAGVVPPETIVAAAERTGLSLSLSSWVVERACGDVRAWRDSDATLKPTVAINVSTQELMHPGHLKAVADALRRQDLPADALCIEITESVLAEDIRGAFNALGALKELGVSIALDDFGTGYSSLNYLKRFPVDVVKIDRSFVMNLGSDPIDTAIVEAVTNLSHTLGLEVVAEGVENAEHLEQIRALSCDNAQGFFFARPSTAAVIAEGRFVPDGQRILSLKPTSS